MRRHAANADSFTDSTDRMEPSRRSIRPRFSLLAMLLTAAVLCLAVSHWNTSLQLAAARTELRKLRDQVGYVTIEDRTKFHAIALDSGEPDTWQWRLFLPKGARYQWNMAYEDIPQHSPPPDGQVSAISNEPYWESENEVLVTARLRPADAGNWTLSVTSKIGDSQNQMAGTYMTIPAEKIAWKSEVFSTEGRVIGFRGTEVYDASGPIILLQERPCERQPDGTYQPANGPAPGFMIWLSKP